MSPVEAWMKLGIEGIWSRGKEHMDTLSLCAEMAHPHLLLRSQPL